MTILAAHPFTELEPFALGLRRSPSPRVGGSGSSRYDCRGTLRDDPSRHSPVGMRVGNLDQLVSESSCPEFCGECVEVAVRIDQVVLVEHEQTADACGLPIRRHVGANRLRRGRGIRRGSPAPRRATEDGSRSGPRCRPDPGSRPGHTTVPPRARRDLPRSRGASLLRLQCADEYARSRVPGRRPLDGET